MKVLLSSTMTMLLLLAACGEQPEETAASPLDVMPDAALFSIALVDPAAVIAAMDSYAAGVPVLGESAVSGWILSALNCADMSELDGRLGIRSDGGLTVYMESMMPQSMGAALTVSDPTVFWANIGLTPQPAEPIDDHEVTSIPVDFGSIYFCNTNGLLLAAGSRAGLQSMLERLDGRMPEGMPEIARGSIYMFTNVELFGPMVAGQLAMVEPQIMAEMSAQGEMNMDMMQGVMGMYFDAIELFLTSTSSWSCVLTFGPEIINGNSWVRFVPGSPLDQNVVPASVGDITHLVPAGDVMVARVCIDPATSRAAMNAVFGAMGITDIPMDMVDFWSSMTASTAMSMNFDADNPLHVTAVYEIPEGTTLEDVGAAYDSQFGMMEQFLSIPGMSFNPVETVEYGGRQWMTFGMDMDMAALQPDSVEVEAPVVQSVSWTAWFTVESGSLYLEMAPEPVTVSSILEGTYSGGYVSDMPEMDTFSDDSEIALLLNIPEYLNMAMGMAGLEVPLIDSEPVWMIAEVDLQQGGVAGSFEVSGTDMTAFIGQAIQSFAAMAQQ
ncbi:MAG: hypothetical protein AVO35_09355 [Candidatus Aegiribacteria sp. MLS_C]|nr:MAG: hypothetical protein AVO35_09355 [Candidatus Aegiribacteria sp. MLS_C]